MPGEIGIELVRRPILERLAQLRLRHGDALRAVDLGEAAGEHRLGLIIKRADKLRFPAVPHAGADRLDVGGGQDGQQLQPFRRLHHGGEILDRLAVGQVARLRHRRHHQMLLMSQATVSVSAADSPRRGHEPARDAGARDRVVLGPALGDVMQKQREVENRAVLRPDLVHQLVGERCVLAVAALDFRQHADAAQQVLVHRVVVVHVELHHRHDFAEGRHEAAEHAGLVHAPQHGLGIVLRRQDLEEQRVGFGVVAKIGVDQR